MNEREHKLIEAGFALDNVPAPSGLYAPLVLDGTVAYLSGMIPLDAGRLAFTGRVPDDLSLEEAQKCAVLCAANLLRVVVRDLGSLDRIERVIKIAGFVASAPGFTDQHLVMNAASEFFIRILGPEAGRHARSALGVAALPLNSPVEIEALFKIRS